MTKKITKSISKKFKPQFSGSRPTPEVTLPTYQRQLVYLERVLNELIDDVNGNFGKYDEYIKDKLTEIYDSVAEHIEEITLDKIGKDVEEAVEEKLSEIIQKVDIVNQSIIILEKDVIKNTEDIQMQSLSIDELKTTIDELDAKVNQLGEDLEAKIEASSLENKEYTDSQVSALRDELIDIGLTEEEVSEIVNSNLEGAFEAIDKLKEGQSTHDELIKSILDTIEDVPGVVLEKRITDVERDVIELDSRVDFIENNSDVDLTDINNKLEEHDSEIDGVKFKVEEHDTKIDDITENSDLLSIKLSETSDEVEQLSTKVDTIPDGIDGTLADFESTIANSSSQISELNIKVDRIESEELPDRVKAIEKFMDITSNEFIEFTPGSDAQSNVLFKVSQNEAGISVYQGSLAFDVKGEFISYDSLVIEGLKDPLNLKNDVTGRSQFINIPVIMYDTAEVSGVALDGEIEVVNEVIKVSSAKLSEIVSSNPEDEVKVIVELTLMFDGNFSVLE